MSNKMRNFQIKDRLGSGSYGVIFKAINKTNKQACVMKQIRMNKMSQKNKKSTLMQATIMGKLNHPFIVQYKDSFIQNDTLHIVMEYCDNGDLSMYLKMQNKKSLKEEKIWKFFIQIIMGLEYIHRNKILHRDIKTLNIFLNKNQDVKIGDLGVAKMLMANDFAQTIVGTPYYLSPELCQEKPYNQKSDIWALGCMLYELCTYKHPFEAANQASLILKIIRGKYSPIPEFYSKQLKDMIDLCLQRDYKRRPTANMILSRPKIKQYIKEFSLEEKVNSFYEKIKANKQNKQPQTNKVQAIKQPNQKPNQPVPPKPMPKQQKKEEIIKKTEDEKKYINQDKKPTVSGMPQNNIILPDKNRIIEKLQPNNAQNKYLNVVKPQQNNKQIKQKKQDFLKYLENTVEEPVKRQNYSKEKQNIEQIGSSVVHHKSRLEKIDNKIQEELKKEKQIQKYKKPPINEKKKSQIQGLASPPRFQKNPLTSDRKSVPIFTKQENKNRHIFAKPNENVFIPPLPPKPKQHIIKIKMDQPPIVPKVFDSNNSKSRGVIKSKGFVQQVIQNASKKEKKGDFVQLKNNENQKKPVLFGLDDDQRQKQGLSYIKTPSKQLSQNGSKSSQYYSEKNIKPIIESRPSNISVFQKKKQAEHYLFKKKSVNANQSHSRVRKGSINQEISRNAKNASRYKQVTKQEEDLVMNLPDRPGDNYQDTSSDQELKQPSEINMNKKFRLKDINHSIVLQKYEQIISSQSIKTNRSSNQTEQKNQVIAMKKIISNVSIPIRINKNLNEYDDQEAKKYYLPQQKLQSEQIDAILMNETQYENIHEDQQILENASLIGKTYDPEINEDEIQDQSQEMINEDEGSDELKQNGINEQIYEINKLNLQNQQIEPQDDTFWKSQQVKKESTQERSQWSFDEEPQLPMLEEKQSPYFEQANPYLVPQQEEKVEEKKNYLQIRLEQNMKRQDQINKLMQIKIQQCQSIVPKHFDEILDFFRKKINMNDEYTQNDEKQVQQFLRRKGLTDQRKFQNIYKILHFEMELENTRTIIQRICKKLNELQQNNNDL